MAKIAPALTLNPEDQIQLDQWEGAHSTPQQVAVRCRILLRAASGMTNLEIADEFDTAKINLATFDGVIPAIGSQCRGEYFLSK